MIDFLFGFVSMTVLAIVVTCCASDIDYTNSGKLQKRRFCLVVLLAALISGVATMAPTGSAVKRQATAIINCPEKTACPDYETKSRAEYTLDLANFISALKHLLQFSAVITAMAATQCLSRKQGDL